MSTSTYDQIPPSKRVENIAMGDVIWFPLSKAGVWDDEIQPIGRLKEDWVQVGGFLLNGVNGVSFQQIASSLGKLADVD
jgi:hypothetical protein